MSSRSTRRELALGLVVYAAMFGGAATLSCAPSPQTVANVTVGNTGCPGDDLAIFNYDAQTRGWRAACRDKLFVCSAVGGGTRCTPQDAATLDPELFARSQLLFQLPKSKRDKFVNSDISAGSWDSYAARVATLGAMSEKQLAEVEDLSAVYTGFSPAFNQTLKACLGSDRVAELWSSGPNILSRPTKQCMSQVKKSPELAFLRETPQRRYLFATDVFGIKPLARPAAQAPVAAAQPAPAPANQAVAATPTDGAANAAASDKIRADLDAAASDILTCTAADKMAVKVVVDAQGKASYSLLGNLAGSGEEGCVRSVLGARSFEPGPLEVVHLVKAASSPAKTDDPAKAKTGGSAATKATEPTKAKTTPSH